MKTVKTLSPLSRKNLRLLIPVLLILIVILIYIFSNTIPGSTVSQEEDIEKKLTNLYLWTMYYLNITTNDLRSSYNGFKNTRNITQGINDLLKEYWELNKLYVIYRVAPGNYTPLMKKLIEAFPHYYRLANTSENEYLASLKLETYMSLIEKSIELLKECRVNESLSIYRMIKPDIKTTLTLLNESLKYLVRVDEDKLLNPKHGKLRDHAIETIMEVESGLTKYLKLFSIVEKNSLLFEQACLIISNQTGNLSINQIKLLQRIYNVVKNPSMGIATDEVTSLKYMIWEVLSGKNTTVTVPSSNTEGETQSVTRPGEGAGYYNYTRID